MRLSVYINLHLMNCEHTYILCSSFIHKLLNAAYVYKVQHNSIHIVRMISNFGNNIKCADFLSSLHQGHVSGVYTEDM